MPCKYRIPHPEEVARVILATLERAAKDRNDLVMQANEGIGKIGVTRQIDDPKKPGILQIDIDAPAPPEHGETKDVLLARLEINRTTGEMRFFPQGGSPTGEPHTIDAHYEVTERMVEIIWEN